MALVYYRLKRNFHPFSNVSAIIDHVCSAHVIVEVIENEFSLLWVIFMCFVYMSCIAAIGQTTPVQIMHVFSVVLYYTNHAAPTIILIPIRVL